MTFQESTKPLLRPAQSQEWREQAASLRQLLSAPPHIANRIEDRGQLTKNLRSLERDLQTQEPKPYASEELDAAVERSDELKGEILQGMPTQEEMRRNPAGAVDKHRRWEKRNKKKITEWKNIQLRRHQTGDAELPDATDIANFEQFRPSGGSQQLNMHSEQIAGRIQFGPKPGVGPSVLFSDQETETLKAIDPEIASRLALMDNDQRQLVKGFISNLTEPGNEQPRKKRNTSSWTPERRAAFGQKMKAAKAAKKQEG